MDRAEIKKELELLIMEFKMASAEEKARTLLMVGSQVAQYQDLLDKENKNSNEILWLKNYAGAMQLSRWFIRCVRIYKLYT